MNSIYSAPPRGDRGTQKRYPAVQYYTFADKTKQSPSLYKMKTT